MSGPDADIAVLRAKVASGAADGFQQRLVVAHDESVARIRGAIAADDAQVLGEAKRLAEGWRSPELHAVAAEAGQRHAAYATFLAEVERALQTSFVERPDRVGRGPVGLRALAASGPGSQWPWRCTKLALLRQEAQRRVQEHDQLRDEARRAALSGDIDALKALSTSGWSSGELAGWQDQATRVLLEHAGLVQFLHAALERREERVLRAASEDGWVSRELAWLVQRCRHQLEDLEAQKQKVRAGAPPDPRWISPTLVRLANS